MRTTIRRMQKTLFILTALITGCVTYPEVSPYQTTGPIYPPSYNVQPLKDLLRQTQNEALDLETFVKSMQSQNLINLERSLNAYKYAAKDLYDDIVNTPTASVNYSPWQTQQ